MSSHEKLTLARLKKGNEHFEIDVDPAAAIRFKHGEAVDIHDVLKVPKIFSDAHKGLLASEHHLQALFGTTEPHEVAAHIIKEGEVQVSADYRAEQREQKKRRLIELIRINAIDPTTKLPHPAARIENAFEITKVRIDEYKAAEDQLQDVLKQLQPVLPLRIEKRELLLTLGPQHIGKAYPIVKKYSNLLKEEWKNDGSWEVTVEVPAGLQQELLDKLQALTHGELQMKIIR